MLGDGAAVDKEESTFLTGRADVRIEYTSYTPLSQFISLASHGNLLEKASDTHIGKENWILEKESFASAPQESSSVVSRPPCLWPTHPSFFLAYLNKHGKLDFWEYGGENAI